MTTPSDSEHHGKMNNLQDEDLIDASDNGGVHEANMDKKLNFEEIDKRYHNTNRDLNLDQDYIQMAIQEEQRKKTKPTKLQPMTNDMFIDKINNSINYRFQFFHYDNETKTTFAVPSQIDESSTAIKHSTTCACSVCQKLTREQRQTKNNFNAKTELEEIEFRQFIKKEVNPDNGRLIMNIVEDVKDEWRKKYKLPTDLKRYQESLKGQFIFEKKEFVWLIEKMLSSNEKIYGCEVCIPETVIMESGLPKLYVKTDKNGCIVSNNKPKCNSLMYLQAYFTRLYTERKRQNTIAQQQLGVEGKSLKESSRLRAQMSKLEHTNQTTGSSKNHYSPQPSKIKPETLGNLFEVDEDSMEQGLSNGNSVANLRQNSFGYSPGKSNISTLQQTQPRKQKQSKEKNPLTQVFNRDLVLIRYAEDIANILSLQQFNSDFQRYRETNNYWQTINSIQLTPNCKIGLGKYFSFTFSPIFYDEKVTDQFTKQDKLPPIQDFMPEIVTNVSQKMRGKIEYDYQQYGTEDKVLMLNNPAAYCLKQCNKICYYIQLVHKVEIVRMKVEFFQDESGFIQFYNATNIWTRKDLYREATETFPKPIDITQIIKFQEQVNHIEQLKNLHFETVLEKVIADLVYQFRANRTEEPGTKNDNRLFDFISDFNSKIVEVNEMKTEKLMEKIMEQRIKDEMSQPRGKLLRKHSSIYINSMSFTTSERQKSLVELTKSFPNLPAISPKRKAGGSKQMIRFQENEKKKNPADLQLLIAFQIQKIGILGQPTSMYAEYNDDIEKFKRHIQELKLAKNSGYTIKFSDDEKKSTSNHKINMLEWLRQQKEQENQQLSKQQSGELLVLKEIRTTEETLNIKVDQSDKASSQKSEAEQPADQIQNLDLNYKSEVVIPSSVQLSGLIGPHKPNHHHVHSNINPRILQSRVISKHLSLQLKQPNTSTGSTYLQSGQDNHETGAEDPYQSRGNGNRSNATKQGLQVMSTRKPVRINSTESKLKQVKDGRATSDQVSRMSTRQLARRERDYSSGEQASTQTKRPDVVADGVYNEQFTKRNMIAPSQQFQTDASITEIVPDKREFKIGIMMSKSTVENSRTAGASSQIAIPSSAINTSHRHNLQMARTFKQDDAIKMSVCKSVEKTNTKILQTPKQNKKPQNKVNVISQIKLIQNKIQRSKDTMARQVGSAVGLAKGLKLNHKFKGWKGLGDSSSENEEPDLKEIQTEIQTIDIKNQKKATFEEISILQKQTEASPESMLTKNRNLFISKVKKQSKFEFENNRMMDEKLRNITEMGMVESLENNMFGFGHQQRCMSQETLTDRLSFNQLKTKQRLIENIQMAVESGIKNDEISFNNETQSRRTGLTDYKHLTNRGPEGQIDRGSTNGFTENLSSLNAQIPPLKVSHSPIASKLSGLAKFQPEMSDLPSYPGEFGDASFKNTLNLKDLPSKHNQPFSSQMEPSKNYLPPIKGGSVQKNLASQLKQKQIPIKNNRNEATSQLKNSHSQQVFPDYQIKQGSSNVILKQMKGAPKSLLFATDQEVGRNEPDVVNLYSLTRDILDNQVLYAYPDDRPQQRIKALQSKYEIDRQPVAKKTYGFFKQQQLKGKEQPKIVEHNVHVDERPFQQRKPSEARVSTLTTIQLHRDSRQSNNQI